MGTVHGVYLKYVGLSALSFAGYSYLMRSGGGGEGGEGGGGGAMSLLELIEHTSETLYRSAHAIFRLGGALALSYSAVLNGAIAVLFKMECGMELLGKNRKTGEIPLWSYVVYFPFHLPSMLYTHVHTLTGTQKVKDKDGKIVEEVVPVASEVQPGWWIGGCYADQLDKEWSGVVDLTTEFPESTIKKTRSYFCLPTWDGVPASPDQIEEAANFAVAAKRQGGDVLVHCAHGRGRSTTIMCACLVKAGLFPTWEEAFEKGIKPGRPCCKLNRRMTQNLTAWQSQYVEARDKKGQ